MICKKGEYINTRQNDVRHMAIKLLSGVSQDVQVEPTLLLLTRERMEHRATIKTKEARLDIRIG